MKFYLLSDNIDTMIVHGREEVSKALDEAMEMENVGIVLMTEIALKQCPEKVMDYKLNRATPLIVEIPDRHATANISDTISKYLAEAVGIKL